MLLKISFLLLKSLNFVNSFFEYKIYSLSTKKWDINYQFLPRLRRSNEQIFSAIKKKHTLYAVKSTGVHLWIILQIFIVLLNFATFIAFKGIFALFFIWKLMTPWTQQNVW